MILPEEVARCIYGCFLVVMRVRKHAAGGFAAALANIIAYIGPYAQCAGMLFRSASTGTGMFVRRARRRGDAALGPKAVAARYARPIS